MTILLFLLACADDPKPSETGCTGADCPGEDSESAAPDTSETSESGESAETSESGESGETGDSGEPWDPNAPLELCINEFMTDNDVALADETGAYPDWIELHNPGDEAVPLDGWTLTDDSGDTTKHEMSGGLSVEPGGFLVLYADGEDSLGAAHLGFKLTQDGGTVGLFAPDGRGSLITYGYLESDISAARVPDCCPVGSSCWEYVYGGTPGETNDPAEPVEVDLVSAGSTWAYWDLGSEPDGDWTALDYDDSLWVEGAGPLGYGDSHIVTTLSYGASSSNKYPTYYFRLVFTATDVDTYLSVAGGLMVDDGAVVYLNGTEVERSNIADGAVSYDTYASSSTSDETGYGVFSVDTSLLVEGENVLAVEVHQHSADSSDMGFDLTLTAEHMPTE